MPLGASFKTSYTPAVDAVEEVTVSKNSVDAENGNSLGGIISLNMKSGTNQLRGSAYTYFRDPGMNARTDPTLAVAPGTTPLRGSELQMFGGTVGGPIKKQPDLLVHVVTSTGTTTGRCRSSGRCRPSSSGAATSASRPLNGVVRTIYNPFTSTLDAAGPRGPHAVCRQRHPDRACSTRWRCKMLQDIPLPNLAGNVDNLQYNVAEKVDYWNFSQRVDVNFNDNVQDLRAATASSRPISTRTTRSVRTPASSRFPAATATA